MAMAHTTGPLLMTGLCSRATVLSSLLARPAEDPLLWQVRNDHFSTQWGAASAAGERGLALLRESATAREDVERLAHDFDRLFSGEHPRLRPCQSAYRCDCTAAALAEAYRASGISVMDSLPADHVANELYYVSQFHLMLNSDAGSVLRRFTLEHLKWAGELFGELSLRAGSLFYQGVGLLGMDYIESLPAR